MADHHYGHGDGHADVGTVYAVNPWNLAVIGYGLSAKVFHIPLINAVPDIRLYGVVQRSPKPDNDASKDFPGTKSWISVEEMLKDNDVDVVVITSIPSTHYSMCKQALQAGKNVIVEKPFVPTVKEADELIALAKQRACWITVYQNRRWDADAMTLGKLLQNNTLGDIAEFQTHFDRHRPDPPPDNWKTADEPGNGALYDLGTHLLDQVYHIYGMPKRVTGFIGNQRKGVLDGPPDSFTVLLHYKDGMLVTAKAGVVSPQIRQLRYWVRGTKGSYQKFHLDVQEEQLRGGMKPKDKGYGIEPAKHHGILTLDEGGEMVEKVHPTVESEGYLGFYRGVVRALKEEDGENVPVKADDARDVLRIIEAAKKSSEEGRSVDT